MKEGGCFWISDLVSHEPAAIERIMRDGYGEYLQKLGGRDYRDRVFAYVEKEDSPRPLVWQLELLKVCGFRSTEVLHKNSCFAAFGAIK